MTKITNNVERLKEARKRRNMTQEEFAQLLHLERSYISQLENGHREILPWLLERIEVLEKEDAAELESDAMLNEPTTHEGARVHRGNARAYKDPANRAIIPHGSFAKGTATPPLEVPETDQVDFVNGDRYSGEVKSVTEKEIEFTNPFVGIKTIPRSEIRTIIIRKRPK